MGLRLMTYLGGTVIWLILAVCFWGMLRQKVAPKKYWIVCITVLVVFYIWAYPLTEVPRYLGPDDEGVRFSSPAEAKKVEDWLPILAVQDSDIASFFAKITYRDRIYRGKAGYEYKVEIVYEMRDGSTWTVKGFSEGREADYSRININGEPVSYYYSEGSRQTLCLVYRIYQGKGYIVERIVSHSPGEEEMVRQIVEAFPYDYAYEVSK